MKYKDILILVLVMMFVFGFLIPRMSSDVDRKAATPKLDKYETIGISYIKSGSSSVTAATPSADDQKLLMDYINYNGRNWDKIDTASEDYYNGLSCYKIVISDSQAFYVPEGFNQDGSLNVYLSDGAENSEGWAVYKTVVKANAASPMHSLLEKYKP